MLRHAKGLLTIVTLLTMFVCRGPAAGQEALKGLLAQSKIPPGAVPLPEPVMVMKAQPMDLDEMNQPLHGPSNYDAVKQFKKIMAESAYDSAKETAEKLLRWSVYRVPDAEQRLAARRQRSNRLRQEWERIDLMERAPFGAAAYFIAQALNADQKTRDKVLKTVAVSEKLVLVGGAGYRDRSNHPAGIEGVAFQNNVPVPPRP
ncbi:MAG: hypothetical protein WCW52_04595 [Elusimicrobiales bacterium]|jgi:hypothetical protein